MDETSYHHFLRDLENAGVSYALLRDDLFAGRPVRDLDLLVAPEQEARFLAIARSHGFHLVKDGFLNPGKKVLVQPTRCGSRILDVHFRVVHRGLEFLDARLCLERPRRIGEFWALSDEDFFAALLLHNLLAKRRLQEKHLPFLQQLRRQKLDLGYLQSHLSRFGIWEIVKEVADHLDRFAAEPAALAPRVEKLHRNLRRRPLSNRFRVRVAAWRRLRCGLWGRRRGAVIAFIGPDGVGKSTTVNAIGERLQQIGLGVKTAYLGPWGGSLLHLKRRLRWLNLDPYRDDYKAYYSGKSNRPPGKLNFPARLRLQVRSGLYYFTLMIEMYLRWIVRVAPWLRRGRVVLADRYLYDILIGYKNRPMDYHLGFRRLLCSLYPRPDIGILLYARPETICARKNQLAEEQLERLLPRYEETAARFHFVRLDSGTSVEETLQEFEKKILPRLLQTIEERMS